MIVYLINSSFCHFVRCVELVICNNKEVKQNGTVGWDGIVGRREWRVILERFFWGSLKSVLGVHIKQQSEL